MAEAGDGNIKVVVRCRPLNSRGKFKAQHTSNSTYGFVFLLLIILLFQNSRVGQSHSFECKATRPFSILPKSAPHRTRNAQRSARLCHLASTRVTGQQVRGMNLAIARNKRFMMTWEKNCWIMALRGLMLVFLLVSENPFISKLVECKALILCLWVHQDGQTGMSTFHKIHGEMFIS